jgi:hypothetical protein
VARVQCHGAPTDLLAAYAAADVPETEVLLFPPSFARIAASAAALAGKAVVSCEAFTCPYGFPAAHHRRELISDLKLLADAVLAQGVNQLVWHGMPYNPPGGSNAFFATTHVGPDAAFAAEIPAFNAYLTNACSWMRRGRTCSRLAVYLPLEDNRMRDRLPRALRTPAAQYYWELRQEAVPREAEPFQPLWITGAFLEDATWDGRRLRAGAEEFEALYLACVWLDPGALGEVLRLARAGLPVALARLPRRPGRGGSGHYEARLEALLALPNVRRELADLGLEPLVEGPDLPPYWARRDGDELILFLGHPGARAVRYPMWRGQARGLPATTRPIRIRWGGRRHDLDLDFPPGRSILLKVAADRVTTIDLGYAPRDREVGSD